jgi:hypothetical protein
MATNGVPAQDVLGPFVNVGIEFSKSMFKQKTLMIYDQMNLSRIERIESTLISNNHSNCFPG